VLLSQQQLPNMRSHQNNQQNIVFVRHHKIIEQAEHYLQC